MSEHYCFVQKNHVDVSCFHVHICSRVCDSVCACLVLMLSCVLMHRVCDHVRSFACASVRTCVCLVFDDCVCVR